jgi:hypothetical protein
MAGFIADIERDQATLFPAQLNDWIAEDYLVRVVVSSLTDAIWQASAALHAAAWTGRPGCLARCRFHGHRDGVFQRKRSCPWRDASSVASSSLRL